MLTQDSPKSDRRSKNYNQAIFDANEGWPVFTRTVLWMVMDKFDKAERSIFAVPEVRSVTFNGIAKAMAEQWGDWDE